MAKSTATINPNLGLYYGLDPLMVPSRALQEGNNFRIKQGDIGNVNLGWIEESDIDWGAPLMMVETFFIRGAVEKQIIATTRDIYDYNSTNDTAAYLNRRYATGTVAHDGANPTVVTGVGTDWVVAEIKEGDFIHFGNAAQRDPLAVWWEIDEVTNGTHLKLTADAGVALGAGAAYTIRRTLTGTTQDIFDSEVFVNPDDGTGDDLFFVTNGVDPIMTWDGNATAMIERTAALGFTCKRFGVYKGMMLYANLDGYGGEFLPTTIINSDLGDPLAAGDAGTGISEQFRAHDGVDHILEIEDMGDNLIIYAERHIVAAQFVGGDVLFVFREAASGVGPISSRLLADFGDYHEFIGPDSQYLFDGVTVSMINQQVWREVLRRRDATRQRMGFTHFDEENGDLIWAIPLNSDATVGDGVSQPLEAFVEHYLEEVGDKTASPYSRRAWPFLCSGFGTVREATTWADLTDTWENTVIRWNDSQLFASFPTNLGGDEDGTLWVLNTVQTGAGVDLVSFIRFGRRPTIDGRARGLLTRMYPFARQFNQTLNVTVRMMDHAVGSATIFDTQEFDTTLNEGEHFTVHYRRGRYWEPEFGTDGNAWQIGGFDFDMRNGGMR